MSVAEEGSERNRVKEELTLKKGIRKMLDDQWTCEFAVVDSYNFEEQTVDVRHKLDAKDPDGNYQKPLVVDVPIQGWGGQHVQLYRPMTEWNPEAQDGEQGSPTVGFLIFPRSDSRGALTSKGIQKAVTDEKHKANGAGFYPFTPTGTDPTPNHLEPNDNNVNRDNIGRDDVAMVANPGTNDEGYYAFKETGNGLEFIARVPDKVFIGSTSQNTSNYAAAAREGDDVGGTATNITEGSDTVFVGD
jgi:hypothetical protein